MILSPLKTEFTPSSYFIFIFAFLFIAVTPPKRLKTLLYVFFTEKEYPDILGLNPVLSDARIKSNVPKRSEFRSPKPEERQKIRLCFYGFYSILG